MDRHARSASYPDSGHRRLAIIDLSAAGCQPMVLRPPGAQDGAALTLVFNGEIYNYRELRARARPPAAASSRRLVPRWLSCTCISGWRPRHAEQAERDLRVCHSRRAAAGPAGRRRARRIVSGAGPGGREAAVFFEHIARLLVRFGDQGSVVPSGDCTRHRSFGAAHPDACLPVWTPGAARTMLQAVRKLEPGCAMLVQEGMVTRHWRYYRLPYDGVRDVRPRAAIAAEIERAPGAGGAPSAGGRCPGGRIPLRRTGFERRGSSP